MGNEEWKEAFDKRLSTLESDMRQRLEKDGKRDIDINTLSIQLSNLIESLGSSWNKRMTYAVFGLGVIEVCVLIWSTIRIGV